MKTNILKDKKFWIGVLAIALLLFLVVMFNNGSFKKLFASNGGGSISGGGSGGGDPVKQAKVDAIIKNLSPSEKSVWDRVEKYKMTEADLKLIREKGEEGMDFVLSQKVKLSDQEIMIFDNILAKVMEAAV